jgi:AcrR family transcriptional regulator
MSTSQPLDGSATSERRTVLKAALVAAAERAVARDGLAGLRARALAEEAGCAVGAIYNVVDDLDDLVLLVNARTLAALKSALDKATEIEKPASEPDGAIARLVQMALAYLDFAAGNTLRWRALFDHRMPPGRTIPDWYVAEQQRLFDDIEKLLIELDVHDTHIKRAQLARSLFSAVHGLVALGLEEKLQPIPLPTLREQIRFVVTAIGRGMASEREMVSKREGGFDKS